MLGLSGTELAIILVLALLLLGPDQLPQLAKSLGKGMRELRKATDDLKSTFEQEVARVDLDEQPRAIAPVSSSPADSTAAPKEDDPAAARAAARRAAAGLPPAEPEPSPADPSKAATLRLVSPEGTVPRPDDTPAEVPAEKKA